MIQRKSSLSVSSRPVFGLPAVTPRMMLRHFADSDVPQIARLVNDLAVVPFPRSFAEGEARGYLSETKNQDDVVVGLFDLRGPLLGRISLTEERHESGAWHIGYYLLKDARKQGYMGEALDGLKRVFKRANAHMFMTSVERSNADSIRVLERAGFHQNKPADRTHFYYGVKL